MITNWGVQSPFRVSTSNTHGLPVRSFHINGEDRGLCWSARWMTNWKLIEKQTKKTKKISKKKNKKTKKIKNPRESNIGNDWTDNEIWECPTLNQQWFDQTGHKKNRKKTKTKTLLSQGHAMQGPCMAWPQTSLSPGRWSQNVSRSFWLLIRIADSSVHGSRLWFTRSHRREPCSGES